MKNKNQQRKVAGSVSKLSQWRNVKRKYFQIIDCHTRGLKILCLHICVEKNGYTLYSMPSELSL